MTKLRKNTYELNGLYHGNKDSNSHSILLQDYVQKMDMLTSALRQNALMHSVLNRDRLPSFITYKGDHRNGIVISDQFLMPGNVVIQLSHTSQTGREFLTSIRTSLFEPKYISDLVNILDGKKTSSSIVKIDPRQTFMDYLRQI